MKPLIAAVAFTLASCAFTQERHPGDGDDGTNDPGSAPVAAACDPNDATLRLCLDFDAPARDVIADLSGNQLTALAYNVGTMDRDSGFAAVMSPASTMRVPESMALDITGDIAIDLWIRPMGIPPGPGHYGILDNDKQYSVRLEDHKLRCLVKDKVVETGPLANDGNWHHVGCTYDGTTMKVFLDGSLAKCHAETTAIPTNGGAGLALGANVDLAGVVLMFTEQFIGGLDNVRVWARSDIDMCEAAGQTGCSTICP